MSQSSANAGKDRGVVAYRVFGQVGFGDLPLANYGSRGTALGYRPTGDFVNKMMAGAEVEARWRFWWRWDWRAVSPRARSSRPSTASATEGERRDTLANTLVLHRLAVHGGGGGAIVMFAILLMTDTFRRDTTVSRWRDPVWLAWLAVPLYWVHQFEEYSLPVLGFDYSIQEMICEKIGFPPYPDCPIPLSFYPVVNIALMWFGAPLAAYLCRRSILIGLSFWGLLLANGLVHTAGGVAAGAYNTGLWSAAILFVPLSVWVIYACVIRGPYSGKVVGVSFVAGALTHVLLFLGYGFFKSGVIGSAGLLVYAAVIGFTPIILAALGSRFFKPELLRPVPVQYATA